MRYFILSDIHANLEALEAVLAAVEASRYDRVICLGDLVGYGANPNEVVDRIRALEPTVIIRGNHDKAASGLDTAKDFNPIARLAARWTRDRLTPDNQTYLAELPAGPQIVDDLVEICHGTPYDEDAYLFDEGDGLLALATARRPLCLFGHTHVPLVLRMTADGLELEHVNGGDTPHTVALQSEGRCLVNPGSVGQPRDGDPRAAYAIVDTDTRSVSLFRQRYAIDEAQRKIFTAGLPGVLAQRLGVGR
ncbi:MAG: metallophosphoesterase family protein [Acidobacteria bacterium]|nr:metallophosphoesterase family protein [Acidobacteriota bacterium]MBI3264343.1 metallophosphoesterase family protein [Acidobacteriota bacterium]